MLLTRRNISALQGGIFDLKLRYWTTLFLKPNSTDKVCGWGRSTLCTKRESVTNGRVTVECPSQEEVDEQNEEETLREEIYSPDGKLLYSMDQQKMDGDIDWKEFERAFGMDHLHNVKDLEKWNFETLQTDDELDYNDESVTIEQKAHDSTLKYMAAQQHGPKSKEELIRNQKYEEEKQKLHHAHEHRHWAEFEKFVEQSLQDPSYALNQHLGKEDTDNDAEIESPNRTKPKRQVQDDGATHKLERRRMASTRKKSYLSDRSSSRPRELKSGRTGTSLSESLVDIPMPADTRRAGYERRIQSLQVQMERIANRELYSPHSEFEQFGGTMHHVMLSTDGFTLKIFYDTSKLSQRLQSTQTSKPDKKMLLVWRKRVENSVRAALAAQIYAKRVPKVELVEVETDEMGMYDGSSHGEKNNIDDLFARISAERERIDTEKNA